MAMDVRARYAIEVPDDAYNTIHIDLGDFGYKHPDLGFYTKNEEYMKSECCKREGVDPEKVYFFDTRPTIQGVLKLIQEKEERIWDEYIHYSGKYDKDTPVTDKWPVDCRCAVYVVTGGSEGLYLHVDLQGDKGVHRAVFLGKSLGHGWEECWLSAARIAAMLNA